jgi:hypothetical protein
MLIFFLHHLIITLLAVGYLLFALARAQIVIMHHLVFSLAFLCVALLYLPCLALPCLALPYVPCIDYSTVMYAMLILYSAVGRSYFFMIIRF